jgi:hypothetical protein
VHKSQKTITTARSHRLLNNPRIHPAKGREWATPGIEAAIRRARTRIGSGRETTSPRIQARLRTVADELAGRTAALTPRPHKRITWTSPRTTAAAPNPGRKPARPGRPYAKRWWMVGLVAASALFGVALWRALRSLEEPQVGEGSVALPPVQTPESGTSPDGPAAA